MSIYDDLTSVVSEVMDEFKQGTVQLVQITAGDGPAHNPGAPTETAHTLSAVVKGVSFKYVQGGLAVSSDFEVMVTPIDGVTPSVNDFITIDGVRYKIVQDLTKPAAGIKLVWSFIVRKGG